MVSEWDRWASFVHFSLAGVRLDWTPRTYFPASSITQMWRPGISICGFTAQFFFVCIAPENTWAVQKHDESGNLRHLPGDLLWRLLNHRLLGTNSSVSGKS